MLRVGSVVLHVKDAGRASRFWSQALGYSYTGGGYREDRTPVLLPAQAQAQAQPQAQAQVTAMAIALDEADVTHLDLHTDSAQEQQAEVGRLISLGATRVEWTYPDGARFVVLADPEGNLFCVVNVG